MLIRLAKLTSALRRFCKRDDGVAAVEAAIVMPVMILLFMGSVELSVAIISDRKLTVAAQTAADLITQYQTIDDATVDSVFTAAGLVMAPYDVSTLGIEVTGITMDAAGTPTVTWTEHRGAGAATHIAGEQIAIPAQIVVPNSFVVLVEAEYGFVPTTTYVTQSVINLSDSFYMRPRIGDTITFQ